MSESEDLKSKKLVRLADPGTNVASSRGVGPAAMYLASLPSDESKRTMRTALELVAFAATSAPDAVLRQDKQAPRREPLDLETIPWGELRYAHVEAIRARLIQAGFRAATVNKALVALRQVLKRARKLRLISAEDYDDAVDDVKPVRERRLPAGRAISVEELRRLLDACADGSVAGRRDAAIIAIMARGGLRRAEVCRLDLSDWASGSGGRLLVHGKGRKERLVWLKGGAREALDAWVDVRMAGWAGDGALICPCVRPTGASTEEREVLHRRRMSAQAIYEVLQKRAALAGVEDVKPHDLRRTYATNLLSAGADILRVQKLLGHESPVVTARYDERGLADLERSCELLVTPYNAPKGR